MSLISTLTATIAASGTISAQVDIGPGVLVGLFVPATWTAANITFQASPDGGTTWGNLFTGPGAELTFAPSAGQYLAIDPTLWKGVFSIKLRSGTSGTPVVQAAQVALTLIMRQVVA